jgi:hypothetical protein
LVTCLIVHNGSLTNYGWFASLSVTLSAEALPKLVLLPNQALSNLALLRLPPAALPPLTFLVTEKVGAGAGAHARALRRDPIETATTIKITSYVMVASKLYSVM